MGKPNLDGPDGIDEVAWNRLMERAPRRRRETPATVKIKPVTMEEIAEEFRKAMEAERE